MLNTLNGLKRNSQSTCILFVPVPVLNPINQSVLLCPSGAQPCSALLGMLGAPSAKCLEPLQGTHPAAVYKGDVAVALVPPRTTTATANSSRSNQKQQQDREEKRTGRGGGGGGGRRRATTINDNGKFRFAMVQPVFRTALYDDVCLAYNLNLLTLTHSMDVSRGQSATQPVRRDQTQWSLLYLGSEFVIMQC